MKKKGFTLIELLAVIVILAIIALIATPIVLNSIENAQEGAAERTTENYIDAVETKVASTLLNGNKLQGTYTIQPDGNLCPEGTTCNDDTEIKIDMGGKKPNSGTIVIENGQVTNESIIEVGDYTVSYDSDKESFVATKDGGSNESLTAFASDSWDTIQKNVQAGNLSQYKVGDTKEITLNGFGTFQVRIANISTPEECNTPGFSQTACGFVVEFSHSIVARKMDEAATSLYDSTNKGGWEKSATRTYVNDTILKSLPSDLQDVIIDTYVVSGHGSADTKNFITTDQLYLLSTKEVFGKEGTSNVIDGDTAEVETRQLDYYKNKGVTTNNYSEAIKLYNNENLVGWWLRTAVADNNSAFYYLLNDGQWFFFSSFASTGISPAFRIG